MRLFQSASVIDSKCFWTFMVTQPRAEFSFMLPNPIKAKSSCTFSDCPRFQTIVVPTSCLKIANLKTTNKKEIARVQLFIETSTSQIPTRQSRLALDTRLKVRFVLIRTLTPISSSSLWSTLWSSASNFYNAFAAIFRYTLMIKIALSRYLGLKLSLIIFLESKKYLF